MAGTVKHRVDFTLDQLVIVREVLTQERDHLMKVVSSLHRSNEEVSVGGIPVQDLRDRVGHLTNAIGAL